jgi:hypothetical protein
MNNKKGREPYNTQVNFITTKSQKEAIKHHAKNFNTCVSEVLREVVSSYLRNPYKNFDQNKCKDDNVLLAYNLLRTITAITYNNDLKNIDQETIDEFNRFSDYLKENIETYETI